jgi:hypothetical protein
MLYVVYYIIYYCVGRSFIAHIVTVRLSHVLRAGQMLTVTTVYVTTVAILVLFQQPPWMSGRMAVRSSNAVDSCSLGLLS